MQQQLPPDVQEGVRQQEQIVERLKREKENLAQRLKDKKAELKTHEGILKLMRGESLRKPKPEAGKEAAA
jgi:uncharacterized protein (UPF0335 family)